VRKQIAIIPEFIIQFGRTAPCGAPFETPQSGEKFALQ